LSKPIELDNFQSILYSKLVSNDILGLQNIMNGDIFTVRENSLNLFNVIIESCIQHRRIEYVSILIDSMPASKISNGIAKAADASLQRILRVCVENKSLNTGYDIFRAFGKKGLQISAKSANLLLQG